MISTRSFLHPFPARMAPEIALREIDKLPSGSKIIDPMMGSGTVLLAANQAGLSAHGTDLDPLAVLISTVTNADLNVDRLRSSFGAVLGFAKENQITPSELPWIDEGDETHRFIDYWFAERQQVELASISNAMISLGNAIEPIDRAVIQLSISRTIVTKEMRASLARDTSHSRPHRVAIANEFDVFNGVASSLNDVIVRHGRTVRKGKISATLGDARFIDAAEGDYDAVITSPPYLNAIDYLRGHRLALVWLGYRFDSLREIRGVSVGAERVASNPSSDWHQDVVQAFGAVDQLESRHRGMINRYAYDLYSILQEAYRVLRDDGRAIYVIGNSCLKGVYVDNAGALQAAAEYVGFKTLSKIERDIPESSRYLPIRAGNLARRMRTEIVLSFVK